MKTQNRYEIALRSDYPEWWRYNVFITVACYDANGEMTEYLNPTDKVYEVSADNRFTNPPADYDPQRPLRIATPPTSHIETYIYIIANTFPLSDEIRLSPPFAVRLTVDRNGETIIDSSHEVNQWGGLTLKQSIE